MQIAPNIRTVEIRNELGLHIRPAGLFVRTVERFDSDVRVSCNGRTVSGRNILDLLTLAAVCGVRVEIVAIGQDAEEVLEALVSLVERDFDEGEQL